MNSLVSSEQPSGRGPLITFRNRWSGLAWQFEVAGKALPVLDKLYRHGSAVSRNYLINCSSHAHWLNIADLWFYVKHLLSRVNGFCCLGKGSSVSLSGSLSECGCVVDQVEKVKDKHIPLCQALINFFNFQSKRKVKVERKALLTPGNIF